MKCRKCGKGEYNNLEQVIQDVLRYGDDIRFEDMRVTNNSSIALGSNITIYIPIGYFTFYHICGDFKIMTVLCHNGKEIEIVGYAKTQETAKEIEE